MRPPQPLPQPLRRLRPGPRPPARPLWALVAAALTLLPAALSAQIPFARDAHIKPVLSNAFVTAYDMTLAPGDSTRFHRYLRNAVTVVVAGDTVLWQRTDRSADTVAVQPGQFAYHGYADRPVVGRFIDADSALFQQIFVEIGYPSDRTGPGLEGVPGFTQVLDTTQVTLYRLSVDPGERLPEYTLSRPALLVAITPGTLQATSPDGRLYPLTYQPGAVEWLDAGQRRGLLNTGLSTFQALLIVVK